MKSVNKTMIESAIKLTREVKACSVLVCVDVKSEIVELPDDVLSSVPFILVTQEHEELPEKLVRYSRKLDVPNVNLTRVGKIKIAIAKGIVSGLFKKGDKIVCLSGVPKFGYADTIVFIDVGREFEILTSDFIGDVVEAVQPEVFNAALNIACELAAQGRENRKVGTIFVLGDDEKVLQLSRQMIMNPFSGYSEDEPQYTQSGAGRNHQGICGNRRSVHHQVQRSHCHGGQASQRCARKQGFPARIGQPAHRGGRYHQRYQGRGHGDLGIIG